MEYLNAWWYSPIEGNNSGIVPVRGNNKLFDWLLLHQGEHQFTELAYSWWWVILIGLISWVYWTGEELDGGWCSEPSTLAVLQYWDTRVLLDGRRFDYGLSTSYRRAEDLIMSCWSLAEGRTIIFLKGRVSLINKKWLNNGLAESCEKQKSHAKR